MQNSRARKIKAEESACALEEMRVDMIDLWRWDLTIRSSSGGSETRVIVCAWDAATRRVPHDCRDIILSRMISSGDKWARTAWARYIRETRKR